MRKLTILGVLGLALAGLLAGCEKDDASADVQAVSDAASDATAEAAAPDAPLADTVTPVCPDEVELSSYLPCTCYGTLVTDPDGYWPGCRSQVVCCPTCQGLRCEDHEYYDIPNDCVPPDGAAVETVAEEIPAEPQPEVVDEVTPEPQPEVTPPVDTVQDTATLPKCPYEVDLANVTLPCMCGDIEVSNLAHAIPGCTKKIVCCPLGGLKCE